MALAELSPAPLQDAGSPQVPRSLVNPLPYCGRPQELEEPKALGSSGNNRVLAGFLLPFPQLRQMLLGNRGSERHRAQSRGVWGVIPGLQEGVEVSPNEARISYGGSGNWRIRTTLSLRLQAPSPPPPPARGRRKPGLHSRARRVRPAPGRAQTPGVRLSASGHASQPSSLDSIPSPFFPVGPGADLSPPSPVFLSSLFPSPHYPTTLLCVSDSGAGPVTSNPVWRRRDWPARAIKRATSSFPITHCQSGNRGGPAGNYKLNTPYRLAPLPGASSFRPPTLLCQP